MWRCEQRARSRSRSEWGVSARESAPAGDTRHYTSVRRSWSRRAPRETTGFGHCGAIGRRRTRGSRHSPLFAAVTGSISSAAEDHQPIPAVSCTSINAHCKTLGAGGSTANSLVIENAGKPSTNAKIGSRETYWLDRFIPWVMAPPNIPPHPTGGSSLTEHGAYQRNIIVLAAPEAIGGRDGRVRPRARARPARVWAPRSAAVACAPERACGFPEVQGRPLSNPRASPARRRERPSLRRPTSGTR